MSVLSELVKIRLTFLVLLTTLVGYYLGTTGKINIFLLFHALFGTCLLASGASVLNQLLEKDLDARMPRTQSRPLPTGQISPRSALILGISISCLGILWLALFANLLTAGLGLITLVSYLFIYTPLKKITHLNTVIGAIPGALPPLMGWTAATGSVDIHGWSLFMILFFWQLPHFMAIAWLYREDYGKAGFVMLPNVDPNGQRTGRSAVVYAMGLLPISLFPSLLGLTGIIYFLGALCLGLLFIKYAIQFKMELNSIRAKKLFWASILYLPLLLILMVLDKVK